MGQVATAIDAGLSAQITVHGVTASVVRGSESATIDIIPGRRGEDPLSFLTRDVICEATGYDFGSGAVLPAAQDTLTFAGETYECLPFDGEVPYRWADDAHKWLRIHLKHSEWARDTFIAMEPDQADVEGQPDPSWGRKSSFTGLAKQVGASEQLVAGTQNVAFVDWMVIVRSTTATRKLKTTDRLKVNGCRCLEIQGIRDPGTSGSVLYLDCREVSE